MRQRQLRSRQANRVSPSRVAEESGMVLLDESLMPIAVDSGAQAILNGSHQSHIRPGGSYPCIPSRVLTRIRKCPVENLSSLEIPLQLGERHYVCRAFIVESHNGHGVRSQVALYLKRNNSSALTIHQLGLQFNITERESEVLLHMATGLSSREVAQRMKISMNTTKTVLRRVMFKMGVASRREILAKVFQNGC